MLSDKWCYKIDPSSEAYTVFKLSKPVTKRQATFLLKKKLNITGTSLLGLVPCEHLRSNNGPLQ